MLILSAAKQKVYAGFGDDKYISTQNGKGYFKLKGTSIQVNETDFPGVIRAAKDLQKDITAVTDVQPDFFTKKTSVKEVVLIGTIGKSALIEGLIQQKN